MQVAKKLIVLSGHIVDNSNVALMTASHGCRALSSVQKSSGQFLCERKKAYNLMTLRADPRI